jgi:CHAD domain-containing protein
MVERNLPEAKNNSADLLKRRMRLTLQFVAEVDSFPDVQQWLDLVESVSQSRGLRGLRLLLREVDGMREALTPRQISALDRMLLDELGVDSASERKAARGSIQAILDSGKIKSERQRKRLEAFYDGLSDDAENTTLRNAIRELLRA